MSRNYGSPEAVERKLNLQLFAGEKSDPELGENGDDHEDTQEQEESESGDLARKSFSDDELSKFVAKSTKKAMAKFLKDIGLAPDADPLKVKTRLSALKQYEDEHKSDSEKAQDSEKGLTDDLSHANAELLKAQRELAALKAGVPTDKVARYVKLAESYMDDESDDFAEAVKSALKDFPAAHQEKKGSAGAGANPGANGGKKTELNAGQLAAQRKREQMKRSNEALKNYGVR